VIAGDLNVSEIERAALIASAVDLHAIRCFPKAKRYCLSIA
jgi:hypothetical protein